MKNYTTVRIILLSALLAGCNDAQETAPADVQQEENAVQQATDEQTNAEKLVTLSDAPYSGLLHQAYTQMIQTIYPMLYIDKELELNPHLYHFEFADFIFSLPEPVEAYDIEDDGMNVHISQNGHYLVTVSATFEPDSYSPKGYWASFEENGDELTPFAETALVYFEEDRIEAVEQQKLEILTSIEYSGFVFNDRLYADEEDMMSLEPLRQLLAGDWQTMNTRIPYNHIIFKEDGTATLISPTGEAIEADMKFSYAGEMMMVHFMEQNERVGLRDNYMSLQLFDVTEDQLIATIYNVDGIEDMTEFVVATRNGEPATTSSPDLLLLAYMDALREGNIDIIQQLSTKEAFEAIENAAFFNGIAAGDGALQELLIYKKRMYSEHEMTYIFSIMYNGQKDSFSINVEWTADGWKIVKFKR